MFAPLALVARLAATPAAADCTAYEASWEWGFKESFRAYLSGSIAEGEWTTSGDIGYETPVFFTETAAGELRLDEATGELAVDGAIRFTGHAGILDTTIDGILLRFEGFDTLTVVADVTGTTQAFETVEATDVPFLTGDLTAAGAEAFGTYSEGESFDPITVIVPASDECVDVALAARSDGGAREVLAWVLVGVGILLAAVFAALGVVRVRSRRSTAASRSADQESG
jgi:hypothetical protein